jgi:hypothetical protein
MFDSTPSLLSPDFRNVSIINDLCDHLLIDAMIALRQSGLKRRRDCMARGLLSRASLTLERKPDEQAFGAWNQGTAGV